MFIRQIVYSVVHTHTDTPKHSTPLIAAGGYTTVLVLQYVRCAQRTIDETMTVAIGTREETSLCHRRDLGARTQTSHR